MAHALVRIGARYGILWRTPPEIRAIGAALPPVEPLAEADLRAAS